MSSTPTSNSPNLTTLATRILALAQSATDQHLASLTNSQANNLIQEALNPKKLPNAQPFTPPPPWR